MVLSPQQYEAIASIVAVIVTSVGEKYAQSEAYLLQAEQLQLVTVSVVAGTVILILPQ
ncbi:MAG: hypothetical protein HRT38_14235 [Alteromonadaceae bacterium]|nr:hypothetical protein [Alteromonadaceae bacterium]